MFYGQCNKCGERWGLGTPSTCKCDTVNGGEHTDRLNKDEELLRQAFDAIVNVLSGADYDDPYASLKEAAKALSDRLGGGLK